MVRAVVAAAAAVLLGVQVVRVAVVDRLANLDPMLASRFGPLHPDVAISRGMTRIAAATREGQPVTPATLQEVYEAARRAPLEPEPFLVAGVQAQLAGSRRHAEQAFLAARWRSPRSLPARFMLADHYVRAGNARGGLPEIGALSRLAPGGVASVAPYVAAFARDPSHWPHLRAMFRSHPQLEDRSLLALTSDQANADMILALSTPSRRGPDTLWLSELLSALLTAGQVDKARRVWADVTGARIGDGSLVYDERFRDDRAPPPFNWRLASSMVGLAERLPGGGLHIIFHGQEDGPLASQILALQPGRYSLSTSASDTSGDLPLEWRLSCFAGNRPIASAALRETIGRSWSFSVPGGCAGQVLELYGKSSDIRSATDLRIGSIRLVRS